MNGFKGAVPCDANFCAALAIWWIEADHGDCGRLILSACETHRSHLHALAERTTVWGYLPVTVHVFEYSLF